MCESGAIVFGVVGNLSAFEIEMMITVFPSVGIWVWAIGLCALVWEKISGAAAPPVGIRLNEILASNQTGIRDDRGESSAWVELFNAGSKAVSLEGYRLTDDLSNPDKWTFSEQRIPAGGHLLVWMSGKKKEAEVLDSSRSWLMAMPLVDALIDSLVDSLIEMLDIRAQSL